MNHQCQCPGPGRCPKFDKDMVDRQHQICSGNFPEGAKVLSEGVRLAYIEKWAREAGKEQPAKSAPPKLPRGRPGTELKKLIASLGLSPVGGCGCNSLAADMDRYGVEWCRQVRDTLIGRLRKAKSHLSWVEKLTAGALAVASGLAFKVNPLDPAPGLLDEALRRAGAAGA